MTTKKIHPEERKNRAIATAIRALKDAGSDIEPESWIGLGPEQMAEELVPMLWECLREAGSGSTVTCHLFEDGREKCDRCRRMRPLGRALQTLADEGLRPDLD